MKIKAKENFIKMIKAKGFNLVKLSENEKIVVSLQMLRMLSCGRTGIKYHNALSICEVTGYEFDELFELKP